MERVLVLGCSGARKSEFSRRLADRTGLPLKRLDWAFIEYIWNYKHNYRPRHLATLEGFGGTVVILRRPADVNAYLARLERVGARSPAS